MSEDTCVVRLRQPETIDDPLTETARDGARRMLASALEAGVGAFLEDLSGERLADGRQRIVR